MLSNETSTNLGLADVNVIIHELQQTLDVAPVFAKILAISLNILKKGQFERVHGYTTKEDAHSHTQLTFSMRAMMPATTCSHVANEPAMPAHGMRTKG